ncbi:MAG: DUF3108 domain-containing protein [Terriglobales bacterium]
MARPAAMVGFLAWLLLLLPFAAWRQAPVVPVAPVAANTAAPAPLTLHYVAHWRLLPAGTASLAWTNVDGARQITFTANGSELVNLFYPVHDVMVTRYDPATFCTASANNDTTEGRRHRLTHIEYEPQQHRLILDETNPSVSPPARKHEVKPIPGCVADLLTALDYMRAQPLHVGDHYSFRVNEGGATSDIRCTVDLRETIATPAGRFSAVRVHPTLISGGGGKKFGQLWVWFSDDARHLPVEIQAHAFWGTLTAQLAPGTT